MRDTMIAGPSNGGTVAPRNAFAMQPPVAVPANGGPFTTALVTRPDGEKVTVICAVPLGSPAALQPAACAVAALSAAAAAALSNSAPTVAIGATLSAGGGVALVAAVAGAAAAGAYGSEAPGARGIAPDVAARGAVGSGPATVGA